MTLYNALGQVVYPLVDSFKDAGYHQLSVDASDLNAGIYFYAIEAGEYFAVRKMTIIK